MPIFEAIILGAVQGVTEWLPVSSEGMIVLVKTNFFGGGLLADTIKMALFLHLGTFLAALIYFRKDVKDILAKFFGLFSIRHPGGVLTGVDSEAGLRLADPRYAEGFGEARAGYGHAEAGRMLRFIIIATLVSAVLGWILLEVLVDLESSVLLTAKFINMAVAALLVITGIVQLKKKKGGGQKNVSELRDCDSVILGVAQGAAVLPGLSRSGLTISALLLRNFQDTEALRLSFLLSLPIVLGGNILLNFNQAIFSLNSLIALLSSFVFGYITIHLFIKLAQRINFGWFAVVFAVLVFFAISI